MFKKAGKTSKKGWKKSKKAGKDLKKKLLKDKRKREKKCKKNKERKSKKDAEGKKAKAKCAEESEENKDLVTESDMKALERAKPEAVDKILSSKKELNDDDEPEPIDVDEFSLDDNGKTILICACIEGELDTVKLLCEKYEADPDEQDNDGNAPLHFAAEAGHLDIVKALLEDFDAEVDIENKKGETPLHVAAKRARLDVIQSLVEEHDAEISAITKENETAHDYAPKSGKTDAAEYLKEKMGSGAGASAQEEEEEEEESFAPVILNQIIGTTFKATYERLFEFSSEQVTCQEVGEEDEDNVIATYPIEEIEEVTDKDDGGSFQLKTSEAILDLYTEDDESYEYFKATIGQLLEGSK